MVPKRTTKKKFIDHRTIEDACTTLWFLLETMNTAITRLEKAGVAARYIKRLDKLVEPLAETVDTVHSAYKEKSDAHP